MKEMIFEKSGLIKDENDIAEIELWGHDGGEFFLVEVKEPLKKTDGSEKLTGDDGDSPRQLQRDVAV
jgi:hypothetical protein